jgi:hypothetical protein
MEIKDVKYSSFKSQKLSKSKVISRMAVHDNYMTNK